MQDGTAVVFQELKLETVECYSCGVIFAMPHNLRRKFLDTGDGFYCPSGHRQCYTKSTEEELKEAKRQLDRKQKQLEWAERAAKQERSRANGYKGALTKVKKRVGNGVCPCCNRSFQNLHDHMKNKHPGYASASE